MDSQLPFPALLYRTKIIPERHNPNTKPPSLFLYRHKDSLSSTAPLPPENGTGQPCRPARSPYRPDGEPVIFSRKSRSPTIPEPLSPQYTLSVKGLRKAYTKMYTKRPEFSQFGAFLCLKCRVHSCTPVYMKKPRHKAGAHCSPMQLWGFATMWCKSSEDFTESFLSLQESSLSN